MLKNVLCIVTALSFAVTSYAQEFKDVMRYEYTMTFKPTIDSDFVKKENVFLDVWDNSSRFATAERVKFIEFVADDKNAMFRLESVPTPNGQSSGENWVIMKEKRSVFYYTRVGSEFVKAVEPLNTIVWNISAEISDYEGMKVQKATTNLGDRSWEVWFTQDIPLIEGPYKFKNLPGFVVKAASTDGDYLFEFTKSEKAQTVLKYHNYENATVVKESELKELREIAANKSMKQVFAEQGITVVTEDNPALEQQLNKKQGDSNNYIEKL